MLFFVAMMIGELSFNKLTFKDLLFCQVFAKMLHAIS